MYYAAADVLVESGLRDVGYDTVLVTCAGWQRDPTTHKLVENPILWPRGYKAYVDYLHSKGLKIGAYGDTGEFNCCETWCVKMGFFEKLVNSVDLRSAVRMGRAGTSQGNSGTRSWTFKLGQIWG